MFPKPYRPWSGLVLPLLLLVFMVLITGLSGLIGLLKKHSYRDDGSDRTGSAIMREQERLRSLLKEKLPFANHKTVRDGRTFAIIADPSMRGTTYAACGIEDAFVAFDITDPQEPRQAFEFCARVSPSVTTTRDAVETAFDERWEAHGLTQRTDAVRYWYWLNSQGVTSTSGITIDEP